jgi:hypothetical protein
MGVFYVSALKHDPHPTGRPNHGAKWTPQQYSALKEYWHTTNMSIPEIADAMGRSWASVIAKLKEQGLVRLDMDLNGYTYHNRKPNKTQPTTTEEEIMSNANIETKTFIAGTDASTMDDAQVFRHIAKLEGEVDKLKAIRAKSTKLAAAIEKLECDIAALVAYVDAR